MTVVRAVLNPTLAFAAPHIADASMADHVRCEALIVPLVRIEPHATTTTLLLLLLRDAALLRNAAAAAAAAALLLVVVVLPPPLQFRVDAVDLGAHGVGLGYMLGGAHRLPERVRLRLRLALVRSQLLLPRRLLLPDVWLGL